jgi:hypothetical protein
MSDQALAVVERLWQLLELNDVVANLADEQTMARQKAAVAELAEPSFKVRMRAPEHLGGTELGARGVDGWQRVWEEWMQPFASFRIDRQRRLESGEVAIRDGKLAEVVFYLDPMDALKAAGIDPGRLETD